MKSQPATAAIAIAIIACILCAQALGSSENSRDFCQSLVTKWAHQEMQDMQISSPEEQGKLQDLLFFLHIPRTGGRNYNQCFLRNLFAEKELCPRSYDHLRVDPSKPQCRFLSTHDDYSVVSKLPKSLTSIVTNVRNPTGRVLSAYEFSVEVASRFLRQPTLATKKPPLLQGRPSTGSSGSMSTLDIWPWKFLVPLMQHDIFYRRDLRDAGAIPLPEKDPNVYDVPSYVMPLKEFVEHPEVLDLVHNGATFQVAGLTNNSYFPEARAIRGCAARYQDLGDQVLNVSKKRLDTMLYVGLTDRHKDSADVFAHIVGRQAAQRKLLLEANERKQELEANETTSSTTADYYQNATDTSYELFIETMVIRYQKCSKSLRSSQEHRRITSLLPVAPVNFSREARKTIADDVMKRIVQLNSLDIGLYEHAKMLFGREQEYVKSLMEGPKRVEIMEVEDPGRAGDALQKGANLLIGLCIFLSLAGLFFCFHSFSSGKGKMRSKDTK